MYPALQLHVVVEQAAFAGQLASVLAQDVAEPSALTVIETKILFYLFIQYLKRCTLLAKKPFYQAALHNRIKQ